MFFLFQIMALNKNPETSTFYIKFDSINPKVAATSYTVSLNKEIIYLVLKFNVVKIANLLIL